ncbi:MAG TPA: isochorismatase family cysteine hydrolase [Chloroflexota bacterium]|nr:isochorismatase family cysteine hydrolase [Chloroflexota bacterium]
MGVEVLSTLEERVAPAHTALLVVDMQNDYCSPGGASERNGRDTSGVQAIIRPLARLIDGARAAGIPIVFLKYTVGPGDAGLSGPEILRRGRIFANMESTIKGTWGHDIVADLPYRPESDLVIEKRRLSAFAGTELDLYLKGRAKTVVVTGTVTQSCVETTVRDAACYDYYVAVPSDCVATTTPELQAAGLASMANFLRYEEAITTSQRLMDIWTVRAE